MLTYAMLAAAMTAAAPQTAADPTPAAPVAQTADAQTAPAQAGPTATPQAAPAPETSAAPAAETAAAAQPAPADQVASVIDQQFATYDKDANGKLNEMEFGAWMVALKTQTDPATDANAPATKSWNKAAFAQADKDKSKSSTRPSWPASSAPPPSRNCHVLTTSGPLLHQRERAVS